MRVSGSGLRRTLQVMVATAGLSLVALAVGSTSARAAAICAKPTPWTLPSKHTVVGSGTAKSCTQKALRSAVTAGGTVTFACGDDPVTIPVTKVLSVTTTTVIDGNKKITLKGGGSNRILVAQDGVSLSVRGLRFVGGAAAQSMTGKTGIGGAVAGLYRSRVEVIDSRFVRNTAGRGGGAVAVWTDGTLTISGSTFSKNKAWYGGAVYSLLSPLTVVNSTFTGNSTRKGDLGDGGAIGTDGAAPLTSGAKGGTISICGSSFTDNTGHGSGGGAYLWAYGRDTVVIDRSTFTGNAVKSNGRGGKGIGGGARVSIGPSDYASTGTITIKRSSFLTNTAGASGGALYLDCAPTCSLVNSTFHRNRATAYGGAIFGDRHHDVNVTYSRNRAGGHGGALFGTGYELDNTVFVRNSAGNPWGQAMTCSTTGSGAKVVQWLATSKDTSTPCIAKPVAKNPLLRLPRDNGGPTLTMLPSAASPVLTLGVDCPARDQRNVLRPSTGCDAGAVQRLVTATTTAGSTAVVVLGEAGSRAL